MPHTLSIGTRGSPLALAQSHMVAAALAMASKGKVSDFPLSIIRTTGDVTQDRALAAIGGKGLFTKEIDAAQLEGSIDIAVHSAKDLPTALPDGLIVAGYLPREDVRDAFIGHNGTRLKDLRKGAVVGTVSLRRQALLKRLRPDLTIIVFRGNIDTRLTKVVRGEVDGTLLAVAGMKRLGLDAKATELLDPVEFPPAVGQAAIAIVTRCDDAATNALVGQITHRETGIALDAERAFLAALDGSCRMPIAAYGTVNGTDVQLKGMVLSADGTESHEISGSAPIADAAALGRRLGTTLRARLGEAFLAALKV